MEIEAFIGHYRHLCDEEGRQRVIRNGYLPKREIQTGIGQVVVRVPRSRDRGSGGPISFRSSLLPPYLRRTRSLEELLPWLYLKGISTGDFSEALGALVGNDAPGLAAGTVSRLKDRWKAELDEWRKRDLRGKQTVVAMAFQLCRCAEKRWQKLNGVNQLSKIIEGKKFVDGIEEVAA